MRKGLLIVALVAASFGGGAVLNGPTPGPLLAVLSGKSPGDRIATLDGKAMAQAEGRGSQDSADAIPSAPPARLDFGGSSSPTPDSEEDDEDSGFRSDDLTVVTPPRLSDEAPSAGRTSSKQKKAKAPTKARSSMADRRPDRSEADDDESEAPPEADPSVVPVALDAGPTEEAEAKPEPSPDADPDVDEPGWAGIRARMRALGVSRYWIEGEPGGPARFRCVIPLAGRQAVGQQFEAEGDDDLRAAEAALRRVALWRATESR